MGRKRFLYDIQKADLEALISVNYTVAEIAAFYGCSRKTIYDYARRHDIAVKTPVCKIDRAKLQQMLDNAPRERRAAE